MHAVHHTAYVVHVMVEINAEATYIYMHTHMSSMSSVGLYSTVTYHAIGEHAVLCGLRH